MQLDGTGKFGRMHGKTDFVASDLLSRVKGGVIKRCVD